MHLSGRRELARPAAHPAVPCNSATSSVQKALVQTRASRARLADQREERIGPRRRRLRRGSRFRAVLPVMLFAIWLAPRAGAEEFSFDQPSDDRWYYPFNFTPGARTVASSFGAAGSSGFNDRDAYMIIGWDTSQQIPAGAAAETYGLRSVRVVLTNTKDAAWPVDLTPDEWFTFDVNGDDLINADGIPRGQPGDTDGESSDPDEGRAIELFGVGFGPTHSASSWLESSLFVGSGGESNTPRDPYPFVFQDHTANQLHVEDHIKGLHNDALGVFQFTPMPWATGHPVDYSPGNQAEPFEVTFDVDLALSDGQVRRYFLNQIASGRVLVIVSTLMEAEFMGEQAGFPSFFTKEGAALDPTVASPRLELHVCQAVAPDFDRDCDVDADDLTFFEGCGTGPAIPASEGPCQTADFDEDQDVDQSDFGIFQRCFSGPDVEPRLTCAD